MRKLHLDFETRSTQDIKKCGAWAYAAHPDTQIMCVSYSIDGLAPITIEVGRLLREGRFLYLYQHAKDLTLTFSAHNAAFEYAIWHFILHGRHGWPALDSPKRWDCTLARAAMCNLPISLDQCGVALNITSKKDLQGRAAMLKLCKPIDIVEGRPVYNEDPALYKTLYDYCAGDVRAEQEIDARLPELPPAEREVWELDLVMNRRGVQMDTALASKAASMVGGLTKDLNDRLHALTKGAVDKASRVQEIKRYLTANGLAVESLDKEAVTNILANPKISQHLKDVVTIRRQVGKTSTSKYNAILEVADPNDQRARGLLQYHGASTGRWAGRLVQPHNFPKGVSEKTQKQIVSAIMDGDTDMFTLFYGAESMDAMSGALRGAIIAGPDKTLVVADYSAIEPRVLFWCADDQSALNTYRAGGSPYLDTGAFIFKRPISKKDDFEYKVAKFTVLGAGYGMGPVRFKAQCATTGLVISEDLAGQAIRAYREKYSPVKNMWYAIDAAAKKAIRGGPGGPAIPCCNGRVYWGMDKKGEFLCCRLPSGRLLRYFRPSIKGGEYGDEIHYFGPGKGGQLEDFKTYGGSLTENIVQAIARDIMAAAMIRLEKCGFPIVLTVHDELVAEITEEQLADLGPKALDGFIIVMCSVPTWAAGCPIAAEGWIGTRYRK